MPAVAALVATLDAVAALNAAPLNAGASEPASVTCARAVRLARRAWCRALPRLAAPLPPRGTAAQPGSRDRHH